MREGNPDNLSNYISSENYIQHNAQVSDGIENFMKLAKAPNRPLNYEKIHLMVGQGNFVATLSEATWADENGRDDFAQVDIFRIEEGKVVEHWDVVEKIGPPEIWNNSGKF